MEFRKARLNAMSLTQGDDIAVNRGKYIPYKLQTSSSCARFDYTNHPIKLLGKNP